MATPGYLTSVKIGGSPVSFNDEPMSSIGVDTFEIDDSSKSAWEIGFQSFEDGGSPIPDANVVSIDHMFGIVVFNFTPGGAVTVSGASVPLTTIAGAFGYTLDMQGVVHDNTTYASGQSTEFRSKQIGLLTVDLSLQRFHDVSDTLFFDAINDRELLMIEIQPGGSGNVFRGWYFAVTEEHVGDVDSLEMANPSFVPGNIAGGPNFSIRNP